LISKNELRLICKTNREKIQSERKDVASKHACKFLIEYSKKFSRVLSFFSLKSEINLKELNTFLIKERKLLLPKVEDQTINAYQVLDHEDLVKGSFRIFEPNPQKCQKISLMQEDLILVPGLGFDLNLNRIGYGYAHFDQFLKDKKKIKKIGIGYKEQLLTCFIPSENHDVKLNMLVLF
jgi:5-formyltetrahydrofolate cyclo-ligase